ncbi:MAG: preprotein translocase subunit SecE [Candidatus Terrybacteria bacterium RIFCSPLOWO2_01_FULL_40_23]|uniref:Protein translocase subunit SecE n=1 Tax=Candidatus Terrybacteria bacterium RIFCSPLOWO2_01_FULL_40_23 TaxID=1802366 RepID=A0A1G2PR08_9BACT|nr:MAG: preprotein translocase subunit SecE [Candidatus Terrybacteria bacterium RIFCSPLOWO2_01_FULL_40_23]
MPIISPLTNYFREVIQELRKVTWLNRKQLFAYTFVVIAGSVLVGILLGGLDFVFQRVITLFINLSNR